MASSMQCRHCRGVGWIEISTPRGIVAKRCTRCQQHQDVGATHALGLPPRFSDEAFETFSAGSFSKERWRYDTLTAALRKAQRFVDDFPLTKARGLLFHGGTPKDQSCLAVATLKRLAEKGFSGVYFDYQQLLEKLRSRSDPDPVIAEAGRNASHRIAEVDVLLLDALGDHRPTEWVLDTAGGIIKDRYHNDKCLLVTTGLPLDAQTGRTQDGPRGMVMHQRLNDNLEDRIGRDSVQRLRDHCELIPMAIPEPTGQRRPDMPGRAS